MENRSTMLPATAASVTCLTVLLLATCSTGARLDVFLFARRQNTCFADPAVVTNRGPGVVPVHEDRRLAGRPHSGRHSDGEVQLPRQPMQSDQRLSLPRGTRGAPGCLQRKCRTNDVPKRDVHGGLCLHHQQNGAGSVRPANKGRGPPQQPLRQPSAGLQVEVRREAVEQASRTCQRATYCGTTACPWRARMTILIQAVDTNSPTRFL
ncbi:hypothetical protein MRX96_014488 [Rhipicephalus microplus]